MERRTRRGVSRRRAGRRGEAVQRALRTRCRVGAMDGLSPGWAALVKSAGLFDRQEAFEADVLGDGGDVLEAGAPHQAKVPLGGEGLQHAFQAAGLLQDLLGREALLQLEVVVE